MSQILQTEALSTIELLAQKNANFNEPAKLLEDAKLFSIANDTTQDYNNQYDISTTDVLTSHYNNVTEIANRIQSEREIGRAHV